MTKGTPKKWQVLDDACFDRDQVEMVQAAINAPSPAQLEFWQEKHSVPLQLPVSNATVTKWRDDPLPWSSADFDHQALVGERVHQKQEFLTRYEIPK